MTGKSIWERGYFDVYDVVTEYTPYRDHLDKMVELLELTEDTSVIDLGSGTGELMLRCIKKTKLVQGVDKSSSMVRACEKKGLKSNVYQLDLCKPLPFPDESFDRITSNNVLGYLTDQKIFITEALRILKKRGIFVIATMKPEFNPVKIFLDHILKVGLTEGIKILPKSIIAWYFNSHIVSNLRKGIYTGYSKECFMGILPMGMIKNLSFFESYSKQDIIVKGSKIA